MSDQAPDQNTNVAKVVYLPPKLVAELDRLVKELDIVGKNQAETRGDAAALLIRAALRAMREAKYL